MGRKPKSRATVAKNQAERMRKRRQAATLAAACKGLAPQNEEKTLARRLASPSLTSEKNPPNALSSASSRGSLSIPCVDMPPSSDSLPRVCTPARVPSPKGVAGQAKLVRGTSDDVTSIKKGFKQKMQRFQTESNTRITDTNTRTNNDKNTGTITDTITDTNTDTITDRKTKSHLESQIESHIESQIEPHLESCLSEQELLESELLVLNTLTSRNQSITGQNEFITGHNQWTKNQSVLSEASLSVQTATVSPKDHEDDLINGTNNMFYDVKRQQVCDELLLSRTGLIPYRFVIQGSFHQGSLRFGNNAGKQCVANCLVAIVRGNLKQISMWDQIYLDSILIEGDGLYTWIHGQNDLLLVSDLPSELEIANMMIQCTRKNSYAALIEVGNLNLDDFPGVLPLDQALQDSLIDSDGCFITVGGSTSIAIKQNNRLYLFDSHARNSNGLQDANGCSVVIELESIEHLYGLLCRFVNHNITSQFEVTGITVISDENEHLNTSNIESENENELTENDLESEDISLVQFMTDQKVELNDANVTQQILDQTDDSTADVDIIGMSLEEMFDFKPLDVTLKRKLCTLLSIPRKGVTKARCYTTVTGMGSPKKTKCIQGDGNCLFRALSCAVSQRQQYHSKIRMALVQHILSNKDKFESFTSPFSVEEHIAQTNMSSDNSWGTALEIVAAADFLKTDIYTYTSGKWIKYSAHQIDPNCIVNEKAIYLNHSGSHYEVVIDVEQKSSGIDCIPSFEKKRKVDYECLYVTKKLKAERENEQYHTDPDFRQSKLLKERERYHNEQHKQNKRKLADRYEDDEDYKEGLKKRNRTRYETDDNYRTAKKEAIRNRYAKDKNYRQNLKDTSVKKYASDETHKQNVIEGGVKKYASDECYRKKLMEASIVKYATDETHKKKLREASIVKYATEETHKKKLREASIVKYATDETHKKKLREASIVKYATEETHKKKLREASIVKYATDETHKKKLREASIVKYATDETHKKKLREASIVKYATDETHKKKLREASIVKYATDETHKKKLREASIVKYATDETHKKKLREASIVKYATDETHKEKIKTHNKERRCQQKDLLKNIDTVIDRFRLEAKKGPEHVCSCCFRLFFENQVILCKEDIYNSKGENIREIAHKCISYRYLHRCSTDCALPCQLRGTSRSTLWICYTCHRKLLNGQVPAECHANKLDLEEIPEELNKLNRLEQHLIALHIPFMKILGLPKGGQKGVHGPVVCVPSNLNKITSTLPRMEDENNMLPVKLKRKITYKGYEDYQYVSTKRLETALTHLTKNNSWYSSVKLDKEWLNPIPEETNEDVANKGACNFSKAGKGRYLTQNETNVDSTNEEINTDQTNSDNCVSEVETVSDSYLDDGLQGVQLDTCLQPADIGQEILDQCFDEVFNISPAEGNKPVRVLEEDGIEAKSFPVHYPSGKNTQTEERDYKLSRLRYFNLRLMSADNRFAKDTSYIFFAQYLSELERVISNVQIALRKEFPVTSDGQKVTRDVLCNNNSLKDLLKNDQATKYLKPVRGTPPYWQSTQKDIFAMIRQLGIPTFFCSFSSADFRWSEMTEIIMKQQGDTRNVEDLDWKEKCHVLNSNPVTLARMFDHRFHAFLHNVILSNAEPIGNVVDFFYRVEFQQRGSPHVHCLFWVEGAPKFSEDDDTEVVQFIDKYISCEIPDKDEDPELHEMVTSLHQHSKNHSKTCKKKGTVCRFNFPRPPSNETFIAKQKELDDNDESDNDKEAEVKHAKKKLSEFWDAILDKANEGMSTEDLQEKLNMSQAEFEDIASILAQRTTVVLKRQVSEIFINHYNKHLLRAWNANMDIQYVLDAYACVVYIISYISKAERELGLLLQQTKAEAQEGNLNAQHTMRKIGTAYLHHRELSAQEAVFRVTGLKLKQCSRKVEFVPVGENPCRMSVPLKDVKASKTKQCDHDKDTENNEDDESIWMTSRVDRYIERPDTEQFVHMCLARFCSDYDVLSKSQVPQKINQDTTFELGKDLGYIRKRTRTKSAIVRYPRFSVEASPEKYYQSILQLFLPYRHKQQLKPPQYETYEEFYNSGFVIYRDGEQMQRVNSIVENNKSEFVQNEKALESAERDFEVIGCPENAWGSLCPEAEIERHECNIEGSTSTVDETDNTTRDIPDLNKSENSVCTNLLSTTIYPRNEIVPLMRAMNVKQRQVFYKIRDWCLQKAQGKTIKPFHVFITGGGGTGKSHLIKCLYYEMTRILSTTTENPDEQTVLLTAPTGTAAFNISGLTIHTALGIFKKMSFDHVLLTEDKINALRSKLESMQVLIIDEISMVNKKMLFFIHQRLRQIKKMPEDSLYGGVSILAVGDFYQLPPIKTLKSDKLYVDDPSNSMNHLWFDLFEKVELDEIMRQRGDSEFSELLNRLRVRCKTDPIDEDDLRTIEQRIGNGPENALHIYATNNEVNSYNNEMVMKLGTEVKLIEAEDFVKDKTSGRLIKKRCHFPEKDIQLPSSLLLAIGSRVMLIKNIDTKDGLVNGVMGTVREITQCGVKMPDKIFIHFDNCKVGKNAKLTKSIHRDVCVGLEPTTEDVPMLNGSRKQFPLKLAWACTVHKVQGMTVEECFIDLSKCFSYGQAYVALSRVTSLNGLYLNDVNKETLKSKIYCDPDVVDGISNMKSFLADPPTIHANMNKKMLLYHNIEGLLNHIEDLKVNMYSNNFDFVCLTETWMNDSQSCNIEGFQFRHLSRYEAFDSSNEFYSSLKAMKHGGVGVLIKDEVDFTEVTVPCTNLECYGFKVPSLNLLVVTTYRTQKYDLQRFLRNFTDYIERILPLAENILVCGDFNQDIHKHEIDIEWYMQSKGFVQCVQSATTESGTLIDHVYVKGLSNTSVSVLPTYYSYHEAICIMFDN